MFQVESKSKEKDGMMNKANEHRKTVLSRSGMVAVVMCMELRVILVSTICRR
jgi:hypothetical protein